MKETSEVSRNAIDMFYSDYTPRTYMRVYGLKNLFDISLNEDSDGFNLKFTYSAGHVTGHPNPDIIFSGPFVQGYHGGPAWGGEQAAPKMSPSPWEVIKEFAENIGGIIS